MEGLRNVAMSLCITAVLTAVFTMLTPQGKLERVVRFSVSLFFLAALVSPFLQGGSFFSFSDWTPETSPEPTVLMGVEAQFSRLAAARLTAMGETLLTNRGFVSPKVLLDVHIAEDQSISITTFHVTLQACDGARTTEAAELLRTQWGLSPTVSVT